MKQIDTKVILKKLILHLEAELARQLDVKNASDEYKKSDDFKQESKYDTRAIEAGYLAGALHKRYEENKLELELLKIIELPKVYNHVQVGHLVCLLDNDQYVYYFILPITGGRVIRFEDAQIQIISNKSPIGSAILGLEVNESFDFQGPKEVKELEVVAIF